MAGAAARMIVARGGGARYNDLSSLRLFGSSEMDHVSKVQMDGRNDRVDRWDGVRGDRVGSGAAGAVAGAGIGPHR